MVAAALLLGLTGCRDQVPAAQESTFERSLLARPAITDPGEPFVLIFHDGESEEDERYGLVTDGLMDRAAWRRAYEHVGHLAPYAIYRPDHPVIWRLFDRHLPLEAAQSLGRPRGASIFGLPETPDEEDNLRQAYADPIGLSVTHFFNDIEGNPGVPGGGGRWRARDIGGVHGRLESGYSEAFDVGVGQAMASFSVSFGVTADDHIFGGAPQILEMRTADGASWSIAFVNQGGQTGTNRFVFRTSDGAELASPPMDAWLGRQWQEVAVTVDGTADPDRVEVTLAVAGIDEVRGTIVRPAAGPRRLSIGGASSVNLSVDDLVIDGRVDGQIRRLAQYSFESPTAGRAAMTAVEDDSGNGHTLTAAAGFDFFPTSGVDPALGADLQRWLVDEMLAARAQAGVPAPELLTNWRLSEQRHRLAAYRPLGFTHGNGVYYLYAPPVGMDELFFILEHSRNSLKTQWAWEDGSPWSSAWLGNVHPDQAALAPEEYHSLIALAVLDGNRYFIVFTGMSGGRLGPAGESPVEAARTNASALYTMAEAASWFQSTRGGLEASRYLGAEPLVEPRDDVIFRARQNDATGELWFAGVALEGPQRVPVRLSAARGTLTNLATGEAAAVSSAIAMIALDRTAEPYHFEPAP